MATGSAIVNLSSWGLGNMWQMLKEGIGTKYCPDTRIAIEAVQNNKLDRDTKELKSW